MATYEISLTKRNKRGVIRQAVASTDDYLDIAGISYHERHGAP